VVNWDEELVLRMKQGEEAAFELCYRSLSKLVYTAIYHICKNEMVANELLQDTFIDAFSKLDSYRETNSFPAWIKRIAFNKTINHINRAKREAELLDQIDYVEQEPSTVELDFSNENLLEQLTAKLSEKESLVIWLYIAEQYSHDEIAKMLNKTPSFSKSIVSRTLKKLRVSSQELLNAK
jgi:RNA polymerase sigma-70 factor (ECF subfamily)